MILSIRLREPTRDRYRPQRQRPSFGHLRLRPEGQRGDRRYKVRWWEEDEDVKRRPSRSFQSASWARWTERWEAAIVFLAGAREAGRWIGGKSARRRPRHQAARTRRGTQSHLAKSQEAPLTATPPSTPNSQQPPPHTASPPGGTQLIMSASAASESVGSICQASNLGEFTMASTSFASPPSKVESKSTSLATNQEWSDGQIRFGTSRNMSPNFLS